MEADPVHIDGFYAEAIGLEGLAPKAVAARLAELADLPKPSHDETISLLVEMLTRALRQIPSQGGAWSWGEFYNGGISPLHEMSGEEGARRMAVCAADLGLDDQPTQARPGEILTGDMAVARNLTDAIERLITALRAQLEAAGVSIHGPPPTRRSS